MMVQVEVANIYFDNSKIIKPDLTRTYPQNWPTSKGSVTVLRKIQMKPGQITVRNYGDFGTKSSPY